MFEEREYALEKLREKYEKQGYEILGIEAGYPGIIEEEVPEHELEGRVDMLLSDPDDIRQLKLIELTRTGSTDAELIKDRYVENIDQACKGALYFENLGYEVESHPIMYPIGDLRILKDIWQETNGVFTWGEVVDSISEPGRLGKMKKEDDIVFEAVTTRGSELYSLSPELEEVTDLFYRGII